MANQYILRNIRALLVKGFNEIELRAFCFDESEFQDVYNQLPQGIGKDKMVQLLLEHAKRRALIEKLLAWAKENNLAVFEEYQPYIDIPNPSPQTPSTPRPPANPFYFGGPVLPENFVGHRQAVEFCRDKFTAPQPVNIAVSGERRIGKTSLLHYLYKFGPQEAWGKHVCLFLDCGLFGGTLTATAFWRQVLNLLRTALDAASPLMNQIIELTRQQTLSGQDFRQLLNTFYGLYPQQFVILMLDEFELIFQDYNSEIETLLNDLRTLDVEPGNKFGLITATRESLPQVCQPFNQERGLEFHSRFVTCPLGPFDEQETRYVVKTLLRETNIEFAEQELNYIWQLSQSPAGGAHPIFVQVAGYLIFEHKKKNQNLIDYYDLEQKFDRQTTIYREEIPQPAPLQITGPEPGEGIDYELALSTLEKSLPLDNSDLTLEFFNWAKQFRRNIQPELSQEANPPASGDLDTIVEELTRLSLKVTGLSFEQLAAGQNLGNLGADTPVEASDPVTLRIDAAVPETVKVGQTFDLAVSIRQFSSRVLAEDDLTQVKSGNMQVSWPESQPYIRLRIQVSAPDCTLTGEDTYSFRLYSKQDSSVFYFHLTPTKPGKISIIVKVYQEDDWLGSTRVHTQASEDVLGSIQIEITSQEIVNPTISIKKQIISYNRRLQKLKEIQALKGIDTEPHYLIEIEDIEEKLEKLYQML